MKCGITASDAREIVLFIKLLGKHEDRRALNINLTHNKLSGGAVLGDRDEDLEASWSAMLAQNVTPRSQKTYLMKKRGEGGTKTHGIETHLRK